MRRRRRVGPKPVGPARHLTTSLGSRPCPDRSRSIFFAAVCEFHNSSSPPLPATAATVLFPQVCPPFLPMPSSTNKFYSRQSRHSLPILYVVRPNCAFHAFCPHATYPRTTVSTEKNMVIAASHERWAMGAGINALLNPSSGDCNLSLYTSLHTIQPEFSTDSIAEEFMGKR